MMLSPPCWTDDKEACCDVPTTPWSSIQGEAKRTAADEREGVSYSVKTYRVANRESCTCLAWYRSLHRAGVSAAPLDVVMLSYQPYQPFLLPSHQTPLWRSIAIKSANNTIRPVYRYPLALARHSHLRRLRLQPPADIFPPRLSIHPSPSDGNVVPAARSVQDRLQLEAASQCLFSFSGCLHHSGFLLKYLRRCPDQLFESQRRPAQQSGVETEAQGEEQGVVPTCG